MKPETFKALAIASFVLNAVFLMIIIAFSGMYVYGVHIMEQEKRCQALCMDDDNCYFYDYDEYLTECRLLDQDGDTYLIR